MKHHLNEPNLEECSACGGDGYFDGYSGYDYFTSYRCSRCGGKGVEWVYPEPVNLWDLMSEEEYETMIISAFNGRGDT